MPVSQAMSEDAVLFERRGHVALITLNRPEALNVFSGQMGSEWEAAYRRCDADEQVRVVVVTGAGRAFCAGADLSAGDAAFGDADTDFDARGLGMPAWQLRKPVLGAINGHALGLGFSLAMQMDIRIVAEEGRYGLLQTRLGVTPDAFVHRTLPAVVGMERALYIALSGRRFSGAELCGMGGALRCLPAAETLDATMQLAEEIAGACAPLAVALTKRMIWRAGAPGMSLNAVAAMESEALAITARGADAIEGATAFMEKREPAWRLPIGSHWPPGWDVDD